MKFLFFVSSFLLVSFLCMSQDDDTREIELEYDWDKKTLSGDLKKSLKSNKNYQVVIKNVNTAIVSGKLEAENYYLVSERPKILETIFLQGDIYKLNFESTSPFPQAIVSTTIDLDSAFQIANNEFEKLRKIIEFSDSVYENSRERPHISNDTRYSIEIFNKLLGLYSLQDSTIEQLSKQITLSKNKILVVKSIYENWMEKNFLFQSGQIDKNLFEKYSELVYMQEVINSGRYVSKAKFVKEANKSDAKLNLKSFKANKDVVDIKITLVDNYKRDTIYNSTLSYYTHGNLVFDFTTGFFYSDLKERTYYLQERDTTSKSVLQEYQPLNYDFAIGAMGNVMWKTCSWFQFGGGIGAALSPIDGKTKYLIGLTVLFFRKSQLGVSVGQIYMNNNVLSGSIKEDDTGYYVESDVESVSTYKKLERDWYVGIVYNLTSKKK